MKYRIRWSENVVKENQVRTREDPQSRNGNFFVPWHFTEFFGVPKAKRADLYARVPGGWEDYEAARALAVSTPSVTSYYSNQVIMQSKPWRTKVVLSIAYSELAVHVLLAQLHAAYYGIHFCTYTRDAR